MFNTCRIHHVSDDVFDVYDMGLYLVFPVTFVLLRIMSVVLEKKSNLPPEDTVSMSLGLENGRVGAFPVVSLKAFCKVGNNRFLVFVFLVGLTKTQSDTVSCHSYLVMVIPG